LDIDQPLQAPLDRRAFVQLAAELSPPLHSLGKIDLPVSRIPSFELLTLAAQIGFRIASIVRRPA
jgi:hypothetical protein